MPDSCSALNCKNRNRSGSTIAFYGFPIDSEELLKKWVSRMARGSWKPSKFSKLCAEHFEAKWFVEDSDSGKKVLKPNAVPSIFTDPSYVRRRGRKKRLKRGRPRKAASVNKPQLKPLAEVPKDKPTPDGASIAENVVIQNVSRVENSPQDMNGSQEGSEYDSDRTTSDIDSNEPISFLQEKLHAAKQEIQRLQDSVAKWEALNEALKPETRDPFLIGRLNVIQKDAAKGNVNSIMLLNSIILYGKNPDEV